MAFSLAFHLRLNIQGFPLFSPIHFTQLTIILQLLHPLPANSPRSHAQAAVDRVVASAHLIVTATNSPTPVMRGVHVAQGTFVAAVGAFTPTTREVDDEFVRKCKGVRKLLYQ